MPETFAPATFADMQPRVQTSFAPSNITTDPLAYLPPLAADRFRALTLRVADLHKLCPAFDERQAARDAKLDAARALRRLQAHRADSGFELPDGDQRVIEASKRLERLAAEAERVEAIYTVRAGIWSAASQVLSKATAWLKETRPANREQNAQPGAGGRNFNI